jgi:hypothetical protein
VLQGGHAADILVRLVEKPTDNRSASLLCCRVADAESPKMLSPALAPAHFPATPSMRLGPRLLRRTHRSRAEGGTGPSTQNPNPPTQGAYAKGTEVACGCPHRVEPHAEGITRGRSGIPRTEKWPSIGIIAVVL